ncbi:glycoside hydrolase [Chitinophaga caeni]|uniref:Glycoside hydrolase n=1 Tax=Chitinophaga caeni TaxID=2029983 RepID=A0A291QUE1_9BACT|nr:glycoside hydrolase family 31 protein [Chitinophaga caeni]ATL47649.1 glycoside hydrolase [Chitinophaga caeni]
MNCRIRILSLFILVLSCKIVAAQSDTSIALAKAEYWYGGAVEYAYKTSFGHPTFQFNLYGDVSNNQSSPILISNQGRWFWSEEPFMYRLTRDSLTISQLHGKLFSGKSGDNLSTAQAYVARRFFPTRNILPDTLLITAPQYNLWIELLDYPTQEGVMNYAKLLLQHHYPPGVLMIDNRWESSHGTFEFDANTFPGPKEMMDSLHGMGFKVMLWTCPFISPDGKRYKELSSQKYLLLDNGADSKLSYEKAYAPLMIHWWDGVSACLDLTNPAAMNWLKDQLDRLQSKYGVDGFKFDAGDPYFYTSKNLLSYQQVSPNEHCRLWATVGLSYPLNEYRAMWKMGGTPLVQRLSDKNHSWHDLQMLIPNTLVQQLEGYTFTCPDMIGGGQAATFNDHTKVNQQLFVRSAQCHALLPMMQFSAAPWRVLDKEHQEAVKKAVDLRMHYMPKILAAIKEGASTGKPVVRSLEYAFPGNDYAEIKDQFMLGNDIMVAPVVTEGNYRKVIFPKGKWKYKNKIIKGGTVKSFVVALDELLIFEKL